MEGSAGGKPSRWWGLAMLLPVVPFLAIGRFVGGSTLTRHYFSGDRCRWMYTAIGSPDRPDRIVPVRDVCEPGRDPFDALVGLSTVVDGDVRTALVIDLVFAASFAVVGFWLMRVGYRHWAPARRRGDRWVWRHLPWAAVAAGALDLVETTMQLIWLESRPPPTLVPVLVASVAWWKWAAYLAALVGIFGLAVGPNLAPVVRTGMRWIATRFDEPPRDAPAPNSRPDDDATKSPGEVLGITASGGGIRSAAIMVGIFRGLGERGIFQRARWVHAVSGGGYTAAGWRATSRERGEIDLFRDDHPYAPSLRRRRRYLDNGFGSIVGGVIGVLLRTALVLGSVFAFATVVGWLVGWLSGSWAIHPGFGNGARGATSTDAMAPLEEAQVVPIGYGDLFPARLVWPWLLPLAVGGAGFVLSRLTADPAVRRKGDTVAAVAGGLGAGLLVLHVLVPIGLVTGRSVFDLVVAGDSADADLGAGVLGVISALGLVGAVQRILTSEIKKRWSRLGGVFLLVGLFVYAGKVADDWANRTGTFHAVWVPVLAIAWLAGTDFVAAHRLTLNGIYRKRLSRTFFLRRGDEVPLDAIDLPDEATWPEYRNTDGPELVLCATAQSSRTLDGGLPASGFSFRAGGVTLHGGVLNPGASTPWIAYHPGTSWDGYPRRWVVSRSMALAGAAFSSAMGRQSYGTTNSLLAATNLRLGMWVPNPLNVDWFQDRHRSPRVHLGYFAKELLNRYDQTDDAYVYVTDGGHRDNLGLVEQLREKPGRIIVLDASGDTPGGFGTMRGAMQLADDELNVDVVVDWAPVEWPAAPSRDRPTDCVTTGTATWKDGSGHVARLVYAKAQISDAAPTELRNFAGTSERFPDYTTLDQFLSEEEWDMLVLMGEHVAERIAHTL